MISNPNIDFLYKRIVQSWFASIPSLSPLVSRFWTQNRDRDRARLASRGRLCIEFIALSQSSSVKESLQKPTGSDRNCCARIWTCVKKTHSTPACASGCEKMMGLATQKIVKFFFGSPPFSAVGYARWVTPEETKTVMIKHTPALQFSEKQRFLTI